MNKDKFIAIMERIPVPFLILALLGWFGYDYYSFTKSEDSPLLQKQAEIEAAGRELSSLQTKLKALNKFRQELDGKRADLRALAQKLDDSRSNLSEVFDNASFIRMAYSEAEATRLDVRQINPTGTPQFSEFYAEHRFEVMFRGAYFQVLLFLYRLAVVPTLVTVESIELRPTGQKMQKLTQLEGKVTIKGYNYLRSKADEISKKGGAAAGKPGT